MPSRKAAPQREVLEVERVGEWGKITYRHRLVCGHTEVRKRPSSAQVVACVACLMEKLRPSGLSGVEWDEGRESNVAVMKARVASRFGVSNDAVDVVVSASGEISYMTVFLDAVAVKRLSST